MENPRTDGSTPPPRPPVCAGADPTVTGGFTLAFRPGTVVDGRYRIGHALGSGASCVAIAAEDLLEERSVVLKTPFAGLADAPRVRDRLAQEARALSAVRHPAVVSALDAGGLARARPYLALARVSGETLDALLRREGPRGLGETVARLRPIASALDAVHAAGLVHGDVKPSNVICTTELESTLIDFGLATPIDAPVDASGGWSISGTPSYLAPEAAMGGAIDGRADVYSLACVAFEMLTGVRPFDRDNVVATLTAKVTQAPPPVGRELPYALDALFARALSVDPAIRPPTAGALLRELVRVAEGRATPPVDDDPPSFCELPPRRSRWSMPLFAIAALSAVAWVLTTMTG
jgi:serine/threonine-protein kinase